MPTDVEQERERLGCTGAIVDASGNHKPKCKCRACGYWKKHLALVENGYRSRIEELNSLINAARDVLARRKVAVEHPNEPYPDAD